MITQNIFFRSIYLLFLLFLLHKNTFCYDTLHFYRATPLFQTPRFERNKLSSFDITIQGGSSKSGFNTEHRTVTLFDIYGTHNMKYLGSGVNLNTNNRLDQILINLQTLPEKENFATFSIDGKTKLFELYLHGVHNFNNGFFGEVHFPVRSIEHKSLEFNDLSSESGIPPNKISPEWQAFLHFFDDILARYDLSRDLFDETGCGDTTLLLGWTHNYQETRTLDFVDITLAAGIILPTAKKDNLTTIGALPFGYQGHVGFPLQARGAIGLYDWLTLGVYGSALFFADNTTKRRIKTADNQSGIIKLAKETVHVEKGTHLNIGGYIEADHCIRGFSFLFGYSFASGKDDTLKLKHLSRFDNPTINTDEMLKRWIMHTLHFFIGYDFANERSCVGPRIGLYYDHIFDGKRIFKTNMFGANAGIEIAWQF